MKQWLRKTVFGSVLWMTNKFASRPDRARVFQQLTDLYDCIRDGKIKKGPLVPFTAADKFIIFSDQHKGAKNGADDFTLCEPNYLAALDYYYEQGYTLIALGDCEELWENSLLAVKKQQKASFEKERLFINKKKFIKVFGNHDLFWANDPFAPLQLRDIYGTDVPVYEGLILETEIEGSRLHIFCTHGHQGDKASDGNWFSKFFVSRIWAPLQAFSRINPNTPAYDAQLKSLHNSMMYDWSSEQKDLALITGHTHQPVFESLTHIERVYRKLLIARKENNQDSIKLLQEEIHKLKFQYNDVSNNYLSLKPGYFNSGCCCFNDGDISGIEIADGCIRLIEWKLKTNISERQCLEEVGLKELLG
jgi:predicted phosphodiesterase